LFANVQDSEGWQKLYSVFCKKISSAIPAAVKRGGRRFCPHLTIANRDIPSGAMDQALKHFSQLNLNESFTANSIAIYTRNSGGGWKEWQRIDC
ncbi:MAG: 2'-5' RNA ligase family protein, partial [Treponema sp.]|nr:2'-5' RNA ligase family protein [Treponema sp.]